MPLTVTARGKAASTPTPDTTAVHVQGDELEIALHRLDAESMAFAKSIITDPSARADYSRRAKAAADELIDRVKQGKITPHEAARTANAMRNQIMTLARAQLTDFGFAVSNGIKEEGKTLDWLQQKYSEERFGRRFETLAHAEREAVWIDITHAAGRSNLVVNICVRLYGAAGRAFLITTLAAAVHRAATAGDKTRQFAKEGVTLASGVAGGAAATAAVAALVSNPGGWVVGIAMFVGAALAGAGTNEVFDYFWPER